MKVANMSSQRLVYFVLLTLFYLLATSQSIQSFSYKWTTIASHEQYSFEKTLNFETPKPYIYRALMPYFINMVVDCAPSSLLTKLIERSENTLRANIGNEMQLMSDKVVASYAVAIYLNFLFQFLTLWILRGISKFTTRNSCDDFLRNVVTDFGPVLFSLMLAISYRADNGFVYDHFELFCLSLYVFLSMRGKFPQSIIIVLLAVLNKETAVLFPLFGAVICIANNSTRPLVCGNKLTIYLSNQLLVKLFSESMVAAVAYVFIHYVFYGVPGGVVEFHGPRNLGFWFSAAPWLSLTTPHMQLIPLPKPTNLLIFLPIVFSIFCFWNEKPSIVKFPLVVALVVNIPLFLLFSYRDEFRNLSLLFPFAHLAAVHTIIDYYKLDKRNYKNETH